MEIKNLITKILRQSRFKTCNNMVLNDCKRAFKENVKHEINSCITKPTDHSEIIYKPVIARNKCHLTARLYGPLDIEDMSIHSGEIHIESDKDYYNGHNWTRFKLGKKSMIGDGMLLYSDDGRIVTFKMEDIHKVQFTIENQFNPAHFIQFLMNNNGKWIDSLIFYMDWSRKNMKLYYEFEVKQDMKIKITSNLTNKDLLDETLCYLSNRTGLPHISPEFYTKYKEESYRLIEIVSLTDVLRQNEDVFKGII